MRKYYQEIRKSGFCANGYRKNSMENNPKKQVFRLKSTYEEISLRNFLAENMIKKEYNYFVSSFGD